MPDFVHRFVTFSIAEQSKALSSLSNQATGIGTSGGVSIIKHMDRDFLTVPVVMMVGDKVIYPHGAQGPEFVPSSILSSIGWDGRPIIPIHPNGVSANTPEVVSSMCFGQIFHTKVKDGKLGCTAYLDISRASTSTLSVLGAESVIRTCQSGQVVEVSTGCYVAVHKEDGIAPDGTPYEYVWDYIIEPDHLAMGLGGATGACSVDSHGCGGGAYKVLNGGDNMRTNKGDTIFLRTAATGLSDQDLRELLRAALIEKVKGAKYIWPEAVYDDAVIYSVQFESQPEKLYERGYTVSGNSVTLADTEQEVVRLPTKYTPKAKVLTVKPKANQQNAPDDGFMSRMMQFFSRFRSNQDVSDRELRSKLSQALYAVEPGSPYVEDVFQESGTVVYSVYPENQLIYYQRTFSLSESGEVTLNDDRQEVKAVDPPMFYEVIAATQTANDKKASNQTKTPCSCGSSTHTHNSTLNKESSTMDRKSAIDNLIKKGRFSEADRPHLEAMSDLGFGMVVVTASVDNPSTPTPPSTPVPDDNKKKTDEKPVSTPPVSIPPTTPTTTPPSDDHVISIPKEEYAQMRAAATAFAQEQEQKKQTLTSRLLTLQGDKPTYSATDLGKMGLEELNKLEQLLLTVKPTNTTLSNLSSQSAPNYLGRSPESTTAVDNSRPDPMPSLSARLLKKKEEREGNTKEVTN